MGLVVRAGPHVETVAVVSGLGAAGGTQDKSAPGRLQKLRDSASHTNPGCDSIAHVNLNALLTHFERHK